MTDRFIPITDLRPGASLPVIPSPPTAPTGYLADARQRPLHDLRISVTDRCNFRCTYCMPKSVFDRTYAFLPQRSLLSFEEITRLARIFLAHGVTKIRITGGEPLLRKNIERLIEMLAGLRTVDGFAPDLTLTTNGSLLRRKARTLRAAGLGRLTVSLDALDDTVFRAMNDVDFPVTDVLDGIDAAVEAGFGPVKVNMVVKRGINDDQILPVSEHFRGSGHIVRFIEFMDVGATNGWRLDDIVPSAEVLRRIGERHPIVPIDPNYPGEVAQRWRYADGNGEIGVISSVTRPFCQDCSRARLSTEGKLYSCLFATSGHDLRELVRSGHDDTEIAGAIAHVWARRDDHYSETRSNDTLGLRKVEMSYIGG
ncbi:MAG: GTP 3',8-cyclase MoaA [Burkholderiaceae bacterium]|nr:GTP 3',8-cyclase MoaA [Burkholderiaceae bacterium]